MGRIKDVLIRAGEGEVFEEHSPEGRLLSRIAYRRVRGAVMSDLDNRRAEIATRLLAGLLANPGGPVQRRADTGWGFINCAPAEVAEAAVALADDLIAALAAHEAQP